MELSDDEFCKTMSSKKLGYILLFPNFLYHYSGTFFCEYELKSLGVSSYGRVKSWRERIWHLFWDKKYMRAIPEGKTLGAVELKLREADKMQHFPLKIMGSLYKIDDNTTKTLKMLEF